MFIWIIGLAISSLLSIIGIVGLTSREDKPIKKITPIDLNAIKNDVESNTSVKDNPSFSKKVVIAGGVATTLGAAAAGGYYIYKRQQEQKNEPFGKFKVVEKSIKEMLPDLQPKKKSILTKLFKRKTLFDKFKDMIKDIKK